MQYRLNIALVKAEKPKSRQYFKSYIMKKIYVIFILTCIISISSSIGNYLSAQDQPVRIGLKFGIPQIAGINFEYVTPLLQKKLAADVDFSYIPLTLSKATIDYTNFAIGANYYFFKEGHGLYGGIAYDRMAINASENLINNEDQEVKGSANLGINIIDLKIGGKHGGLFYFRWELGYRLALNKPIFDIVASSPDGTTVSKSIKFPISNGLMGDIGFGFSF